MKFKKKNRAPLSHSNLSEHENLRSHYDPNGSWTGTPASWDEDVKSPSQNVAPTKRDAESDRDVYGDFKPTENGYVQQEGNDAGSKRDIEAGNIAEYPLEGQIAPQNGDSYEENTRNMQSHDYPDHTAGNGMADAEASGDMYSPLIDGKNGEYEKQGVKNLPADSDKVYDDQAPMESDVEAGADFYHEKLNSDVESGDDIYQNDIDFDPSEYESGDWKKSPQECPAPKRDAEIANDFSALGDVGLPAGVNGYPEAEPVQDADDL